MKSLYRASFATSLAAVFVFGFLGTGTALAAGPAAVNLLSAANFVVISETGITNTGSHTSVITGNIGSSPITAASMDGVFCSEITGTIYGVDAAYTGSGVTTCFSGTAGSKTLIDNAVLDMGTAYTNAAGRPTPDGTELYAGNLGGRTFAPGLYKWSTDVTIPTSVTLSGGPNDVWIFQIAGNLTVASAGSVPSGIKVILAGGAQASNVFWQVGGVTGATLGTYSTFNGTILAAKQVILQTGAVLNGRALAQTQAVLDANTIGVPAATVAATLHVITVVNNGSSGTATPSSFMLHVKSSGTDVSGSPATGAGSPGTLYTLAPGAYTVSEDPAGQYSTSLSGDCDASGNVTTVNGADKICTVTDTYSGATASTPAVAASGGGGGSTHYGCTDPKASNYEGFAASEPSLCIYGASASSPAPTPATVAAAAPLPVLYGSTVPKLPNTGFPPRESGSWQDTLLVFGIIAVTTAALAVGFQKTRSDSSSR